VLGSVGFTPSGRKKKVMRIKSVNLTDAGSVVMTGSF
jgi:hypothetical protein